MLDGFVSYGDVKGDTATPMYYVRRGEYKGHAMLEIWDGPSDRMVISFGVRKARAIAAVTADICKWVSELEEKKV